MRLRDIQTKHIQEYQSARVEKDGVSGRTVNVEMATLRQTLKANKQWARLADEYKGLKERHDVGRALDTDEIKRLLEACEQSPSRSLHVAFLVSMHTGLRSKELRTLQWKQIDLDSNPAFITVGEEAKTEAGKGRIIPLSPLAKSVLVEWKSKLPWPQPKHYVFASEQYHFQGNGRVLKLVSCDPTKPVASFHQSWKTAKKLADVECRWHDCRHTFISTLAETHTPDATIMSLAGHVSRKMLERYSHSRNTAKIDAINRAFGVGPELPPAKIKRIR